MGNDPQRRIYAAAAQLIGFLLLHSVFAQVLADLVVFLAFEDPDEIDDRRIAKQLGLLDYRLSALGPGDAALLADSLRRIAKSDMSSAQREYMETFVRTVVLHDTEV